MMIKNEQQMIKEEIKAAVKETEGIVRVDGYALNRRLLLSIEAAVLLGFNKLTKTIIILQACTICALIVCAISLFYMCYCFHESRNWPKYSASFIMDY